MQIPIKNILIVGGIHNQTQQRVNAFRNLGYVVTTISETPNNFAPGINYTPSLEDRIRHKLGLPKDKLGINKQLLALVKTQAIDLVWVEKALTLKYTTLKRISSITPKTILAWYSGDDMYARHNQSYYFRKSLRLYNIVYTTKSYNCNPDELPKLGAKKVVFVHKTFDPHTHFPIAVTAADIAQLGSDVGFIGTFERDRAEKMLYLAKNGIKLRIWGNGWGKYLNLHPNLKIENAPIYDQSYQKAICATKINLCFLRKLNRDLQTDRSIEIPACGAFMLAERTIEHQSLFLEDQEAVFFDINNPKELLAKVQYYLHNDKARLAIAAAGRQRCITSDYSHENAIKTMLLALQG